ncbi:putative bifunctional diguanylate cyclase/phosphodiesterase [Roseicyclus marinus]|uniref:putative bifunctional diguanylate cyclase/phosphodiesterase n=1 Tax=Roseicyclus marinus TaxID=2161673 RepID=UPI00240F3910|nr:GGDEF domain-containing phosphodiesterase [Roseicyclus marinus]MDG3043080.1 GGDEF domain-containing phosphodiesterase [Roseicyclus marinus]
MTLPDTPSEWIGRFDHVTRLPNRTQLLEKLSRTSAKEDLGDPKVVLVLVTLADAEHFNQLLRALGHDFSEDFIRAGARRIGSLLPDGVTLFNVSVLSFAFVLEGESKASQTRLVEAIGPCFAEPIKLGGIPVRSRAGVGVVDLEYGVSDPAEVLRAALTAAQDSRHKQQPYATYDPETDSKHRRGFRILTDLPEALRADDQIELHYQPRIDLKTDRCVAVEALFRWTHPVLGPISPVELFPLVESTTLIRPLTEKVLDVAIQQLAVWSKTFEGLSMSVNVSPNNLSEPDFAQKLQRLLRERGVNARHLELEFTEGAVAADDAATLRALTQIRALGMTVAIDDFGSGYSNMAYLTQIPADIIKIDKQFVLHVEPSGQSGFLLRKIVELAGGLGFEVVGEGVETGEAYAFLKAIGCAQAQGYHIARPMPAARLTEWLTIHAETAAAET